MFLARSKASWTRPTLDVNSLDEAERTIQEALQLDPYNAEFFALQANVAFQRDKWQDALAAAEQGLAIDPEHVDCANLRATSLVKPTMTCHLVIVNAQDFLFHRNKADDES